MFRYEDQTNHQQLNSAIPIGHRILVYDTFECASDITRALLADGLEPHLIELAKPFGRPNVQSCGDGYGPGGRIRWAIVTLRDGQYERGAVTCRARGLEPDWEFNCFSSQPPSQPADRCPGCSASLVEGELRCPECGLRLGGPTPRRRRL